MIYDCDIEMTEATDVSSGESRWCEPSEVEEIKKKVYATFYQTAIGREFKENYLAASMECVEAEYRRRYGVVGQIGKQWPGVVLSGRLEAVVGDLMRIKDAGLVTAWEAPKPVPLPAPSTPEQEHAALVAQIRRDMEDPAISVSVIAAKRKNSAAYAKAWRDANDPSFGIRQEEPSQAPSELIRFAHLLNAEILARGIPKPAAGRVTIEANGTKYEYPIAEFRELSDRAVSYGLIR